MYRNHTTILCINCENPFNVRPSELKRRKRFCSTSCSKSYPHTLKAVRTRFDKYIKKTAYCWLWTGATNKGYGVIGRPGGGNWEAHRLSYELENGIEPGTLPSDIKVTHLCNNPPCVRPSHLKPDTQAGNMRYMDECGRRVSGNHRGVNNGNAKLTENDVREIRSRATKGESVLVLAQEFGVVTMAIRHVIKRRTWESVA